MHREKTEIQTDRWRVESEEFRPFQNAMDESGSVMESLADTLNLNWLASCSNMSGTGPKTCGDGFQTIHMHWQQCKS